MTKGFTGFLIGILLMYIAYPIINSESNIQIDYAEVETIQGIMVFTNSKPVNLDQFNSIITLDDANIDNILKNLKNKDKSDFEKAIGFLKGTMDAEEKLKLIVQVVKQNYSNSDAIILRNGFSTCEVLELK